MFVEGEMVAEGAGAARLPVSQASSVDSTSTIPWPAARGQALIGSICGSAIPRTWYAHGMRTTIDGAGRLVLPRAIREQVGIHGPTEVEIESDGAAVRIEPLSDGTLATEAGRLVIPRTGVTVSADSVARLRDADRR